MSILDSTATRAQGATSSRLSLTQEEEAECSAEAWAEVDASEIAEAKERAQEEAKEAAREEAENLAAEAEDKRIEETRRERRRVLGNLERPTGQERDELQALVIADSWPPIDRFDREHGEAFPTEVLPDSLVTYVQEVSHEMQTPEGYAGPAVLAAVASAIQGRVRVAMPAFSEPTNLFIAVIAPPASRKSGVWGKVFAPLERLEEEQQAAALPEIARAAEVLQCKQLRLRHLRSIISKDKDPAETEEAKREALELAVEVKQLEDSAGMPPRLIAADTTVEALASTMAASGERLSLVTAEGSEIFDLALGRYGNEGQSNFDFYLKAHAGDPHRVDRRSSPPIRLKCPALTTALALQPEVLQALDAPALRRRGLLGRFCYSCAPSGVGDRETSPRPMRDATRLGYDSHIRGLFRAANEDFRLELDPEALRLWEDFSRALEPRLKAHVGDLCEMGDWAGKLCGLVLRLAAGLHCSELVGRKMEPKDHRIGARAMKGGLRLGEYFLDHARVVFGGLGVSEGERLAARVWGWIERTADGDKVGDREIRQAMRGGGIRESSQLDAPLAVLTRRGYLHEIAKSRPQMWAINPEAREK